MPKTIIERVQKYRDGLRQAGLRPVQIWVPDFGDCQLSRAFAAALHADRPKP